MASASTLLLAMVSPTIWLGMPSGMAPRSLDNARPTVMLGALIRRTAKIPHRLDLFACREDRVRLQHVKAEQLDRRVILVQQAFLVERHHGFGAGDRIGTSAAIPSPMTAENGRGCNPAPSRPSPGRLFRPWRAFPGPCHSRRPASRRLRCAPPDFSSMAFAIAWKLSVGRGPGRVGRTEPQQEFGGARRRGHPAPARPAMRWRRSTIYSRTSGNPAGS